MEAGLTLPITTAHNTVRISFNMGAAEYKRLQKECPIFPRRHFSMLADTKRNQAGAPLRPLRGDAQHHSRERHDEKGWQCSCA